MRTLSKYLNTTLFFSAIILLAFSCKQAVKETATVEATAATQKTAQQQPVTANRKVVQQPALQKRQVQTPPNKTRSLNAKQQATRPKYPTEPKIPGGKINWMTFEQVQKAMKKEKRKVFVDVYTDWCGWCKRLDKTTFADKRVADYMNENFYAVKFDAQEPGDITVSGEKYANPNFDASRPKRARNATHQLAVKYGARSYPTVLFLNEQMGLIKAVPGYRTADNFLPLLAQFNQ